MKLTDFLNEVARRADTSKTSISVAETRRVLSEAFALLHELSSTEAADVVAKGLASAAKRQASGRKKR